MEVGSIGTGQWVGQVLGNYRLLRPLGEGGMGAVYEGRHEQISRRAAIKILHAELARNPAIVTRFLNEARAANLVQHPGIVDIYEFGQTPDGSAYIVMQYLEGDSLRGRLRRLGTLGTDALRLGRQIASALAAAHEQKIVHRDLKPENIMIVADPEAPGRERAKVLDFGIAKLAAELKTPGEQYTRTGAVMGTPAYMAPEQCRGLSDLDDRADVYALGIMLYEMVAGVTPFRGDMGELFAAHLYQAPPPLWDVPGVPAAVHDLVHQMLAKERAERPAMRDVLARLEVLSTTSSVVAVPAVRGKRGRSMVGLGAGGLALAGLLALLGYGVQRLVRVPVIVEKSKVAVPVVAVPAPPLAVPAAVVAAPTPAAAEPAAPPIAGAKAAEAQADGQKAAPVSPGPSAGAAQPVVRRQGGGGHRPATAKQRLLSKNGGSAPAAAQAQPNPPAREDKQGYVPKPVD